MPETEDDEATGVVKEEAAHPEGAEEHDEDVDFDVCVEVTELGPCSKNVRVQIARQDIQKTLDEAFKKLRNEVMVPGFRKGRAPRWVLERRFGRQLKDDLQGKLVNAGVRKAFQKSKLQVMGMPRVEEDKIVLDFEKDFYFDVKCYVRPDFDLNDYMGMEIEIPAFEVTDAAVEEALKAMLWKEGMFEDAPADHVASAGDVAVCDAKLEVEDAVVWEQKALDLHLGERGRSSMVVPELVDTALGGKSGDVRTAAVTLSARYPEEKLRGKTGTLTVLLQKVKALQMPEFTLALAKKYGFEDVDSARRVVRERLEERHSELTGKLVDEAIRLKLLKKAAFELPEALVAQEVETRCVRARDDLARRGMDEARMEEEVARLKPVWTEEVAREIRLTLVMQKICEKEGVKVEEGDLDDRIEAMAREGNEDPFELRERYEQDGTLELLRSELLQDRTFELLKHHAVVVKKEAGQNEPDASASAVSPEAEAQAKPI